jgi:hypothetical protein
VIRGRALSLLRDSPHYRADAFRDGLTAIGFEVVSELPNPQPGDILLIWNREGGRLSRAIQFEIAGARVVVAENGYLGKEWIGRKWFALALGHHAGAGLWPIGGPERWDGWYAELEPWRAPGGETVVLAQRGIGEPGVAAPADWAQIIAPAVRGRIRRHPGTNTNSIPLRADLAKADSVVTWSSGAALLALTYGVPVFYGFPRWIGAPASQPLALFSTAQPLRNDAARLEMFRRLAWAQWTVEEIRSGEAFERLLRS